MLNFIIIDSFLKIGTGQVVENFFPEKMILDLSESHHFWKIGKKRYEKKVELKENFLNTLFFYVLNFFIKNNLFAFKLALQQ